jgi:hypothetical protein
MPDGTDDRRLLEKFQPLYGDVATVHIVQDLTKLRQALADRAVVVDELETALYNLSANAKKAALKGSGETGAAAPWPFHGELACRAEWLTRALYADVRRGSPAVPVGGLLPVRRRNGRRRGPLERKA